jgi:glycosyltransferase involved in cell wall biosynthesis
MNIATRERVLRRPKLLFLARPFPPLRATACVRTHSIAKYLARLGWDVTVVTPHPRVWRHVDKPELVEEQLKHEGIRRILTDHDWRFLSPGSLKCWNQGPGWLIGGVCRRVARSLGLNSGMGWARAAESACSAVKAEEVDVILATGSPFASFGLAKRLATRLRRPYIVDYRDPWTGNPHAPAPQPKRVIQEEVDVLAQCAAATVVSASWAKAMDQSFGVGSKLHVISNGYDPQELESVEPFNFGHFAIVYTGTFYPPKRVISPVLAALRKLNDTLGDGYRPWYFHYFGRHETHVRDEAARFGITEKVVFHGNVPHEEALSAVRGANVAVVITSVSSGESLADQGIVPAKVFEALGLRTPVLLICPSGGDAAEIIRESQTGAAFNGSETDTISQFLGKMVRSQIHFDIDGATQEWAWPRLIGKLDQILRSTVNQFEVVQ